MMKPVGKRSGMPIDTQVGKRVRMRRLMLDMSQTQLADALGVTFQQVQKYESGQNRISAGRLQRVAEVLNVPVALFFEGVVGASGGSEALRASSPADVFEFLSTVDGVALVKAYMQIKETKLRRSIVHLFEAIASHPEANAAATPARRRARRA